MSPRHILYYSVILYSTKLHCTLSWCDKFKKFRMFHCLILHYIIMCDLPFVSMSVYMLICTHTCPPLLVHARDHPNTLAPRSRSSWCTLLSPRRGSLHWMESLRLSRDGALKKRSELLFSRGLRMPRTDTDPEGLTAVNTGPDSWKSCTCKAGISDITPCFSFENQSIC